MTRDGEVRMTMEKNRGVKKTRENDRKEAHFRRRSAQDKRGGVQHGKVEVKCEVVERVVVRGESTSRRQVAWWWWGHDDAS